MTDRKAVAARVYELFDAGDVAGLDQVIDQGMVDHNPVPGTSSGIDGMRALVAAVREGFTDHTGSWFGTPPTGREVSFTGTDIVRVPNDKITEIRHVEELLQLQQQLTS
jgi:predicted ester cyclase